MRICWCMLIMEQFIIRWMTNNFLLNNQFLKKQENHFHHSIIFINPKYKIISNIFLKKTKSLRICGALMSGITQKQLKILKGRQKDPANVKSVKIRLHLKKFEIWIKVLKNKLFSFLLPLINQLLKKLLTYCPKSQSCRLMMENNSLIQNQLIPLFSKMLQSCLLYTSDAADEEDSVDHGGARDVQIEKNIEQRKIY
eukprot:TRINITY_DN13599_c0_g1_i3.p1 TRINITY_DN13599_c0_g1~~TRINITY_DN13599_c0_g1_i3.p1  ORF type:complete len:197 (+),score=13.71 TRINITY_DN13599_c0_g1_i3:220-810(+)